MMEEVAGPGLFQAKRLSADGLLGSKNQRHGAAGLAGLVCQIAGDRIHPIRIRWAIEKPWGQLCGKPLE